MVRHLEVDRVFRFQARDPAGHEGSVAAHMQGPHVAVPGQHMRLVGARIAGAKGQRLTRGIGGEARIDHESFIAQGHGEEHVAAG